MSVKILITGDYCPIGRNQTSIENNVYSFIDPFEIYTRKADFSITNLEAPVTESETRIVKAGPNIKVGHNALDPLRKLNFNLVTLANNHILDYSEEGVISTIKYCEENDLDYVGAGANLKKARECYIKEINGKTIGILNFAENEFCAASKSSYGANPVNTITNHYDIIKAKDEVDYLIVIAHGGREHYQLPTPKQRERYRFYADSGADIVVGHHAHCFSGYEYHNETPIFYSLGNFIFDYKKKYQKGTWTEGYAVEFTITENKINFDLIPFFQGRESNPSLSVMKGKDLLHFKNRIEELNSTIINDDKFEESWILYLKSQKRLYKSSLFVKNKYLRGLMIKGFIPLVLPMSKSYKSLVLNLFRCETHKEIISNILEKEL